MPRGSWPARSPPTTSRTVYQERRDLAPCESIVAAVHDANGRIYAKGQNSVDFHGMGTTCSCLLLLPDGALAAHVGDSRGLLRTNVRTTDL